MMSDQVANELKKNATRAVPKNKPRVQKPVLPSLPKAKSLYDYNPQDLDELELKEGDVLEILKERESCPFDFYYIIHMHNRSIDYRESI